MISDDQRRPMALSLPSIIDKFLSSGKGVENAEALEKILAVFEHMEERAAACEFAAAFAQLQKDMPVVKATKPVPDKHGNIKYHFAPYEDIMEQVRPLLERHGFSVTFSMDFREGRIIQTCTLTHVGGHARSNQFMARIGSGPPGSSDAQADGAAATYAKRYALCSALNIVCEVDTDGRDARKEGEFINPEQVAWLKEQVREVGFKEETFFHLAGASSYEEIGTGKYEVLARAIEMKRGQRR